MVKIYQLKTGNGKLGKHKKQTSVDTDRGGEQNTRNMRGKNRRKQRTWQ